MLKVCAISGLSGKEFEEAVNKAIANIEGCFTHVTKVETYQEEEGLTAVIYYDTEYYTI